MLGGRPWQGEHHQGADPRHSPGAGWAGGLRGVGLVQEQSTRYSSGPNRISLLPVGDAHLVPQDQAAHSDLWGGSSEKDGVQGPRASPAMKER